jgi:hypothetical protein
VYLRTNHSHEMVRRRKHWQNDTTAVKCLRILIIGSTICAAGRDIAEYILLTFGPSPHIEVAEAILHGMLFTKTDPCQGHDIRNFAACARPCCDSGVVVVDRRSPLTSSYVDVHDNTPLDTYLDRRDCESRTKMYTFLVSVNEAFRVSRQLHLCNGNNAINLIRLKFSRLWAFW